MNRTEYLLTCLGEECNEVAQRCSKAIRFGLSEVQPGQDLTNGKRIAMELADVLAVLEMLEECDGRIPDPYGLHNAVRDKKAKLEKYMRYSFVLGILDKS